MSVERFWGVWQPTANLRNLAEGGESREGGSYTPRNNLAWWPRGTVLAAPSPAGQPNKVAMHECVFKVREENKVFPPHQLAVAPGPMRA